LLRSFGRKKETFLNRDLVNGKIQTGASYLGVLMEF
jgi:hypothetical protein